MLDAARNDEEVTGAQFDVGIAQLDRKVALEDEEKIVGVGVRVPDELAFCLREEHLVVVVTGDDPRRPGLIESRQCRGPSRPLPRSSAWARGFRHASMIRSDVVITWTPARPRGECGPAAGRRATPGEVGRCAGSGAGGRAPAPPPTTRAWQG